MSEPTRQQSTEQTRPVDEAMELETLRRVNAEILTKRKKDRERIAALEAESASAQAKATEAQAVIHELTINGPLKAMASSISTVPDVFREFFSRDHKLEMQDGVLMLLSTDGKPVMKDGKAVPFEANAIKNLLLSSKDESKLRLYNSILIGSKASGAAGHSSTGKDSPSPKAGIQFGLR